MNNLEDPNPFKEEYTRETLEEENTGTAEQMDQKDIIEEMENRVRAGEFAKIILTPNLAHPADITVYYINMSSARKNNVFLQPDGRNGTQVEE